jgi:hypothetical protein
MLAIPCVKWSAENPEVAPVLLCLLAASGILAGLVVITAPWRKRSSLAKLPTLQLIWMGVFSLFASLGLLLIFLPPLLGVNRCT